MSKKAIKRIMNDIIDLQKSPLYNDGIYYHVNENNIMNWKALIIGQKDTPYYGGFYFFDIIFPDDYPFSPPRMSFKTYFIQQKYNNSAIRFNPNLYVNGLVCLSLLNTWTGDKWTPINTISSVFLSIQALVLIDDPLQNEPGYEKNSDKYHYKLNDQITDYNNVIKSANILAGIINPLMDINKDFIMFDKIIKKYFISNYENIYIKHIDNLISFYGKNDLTHKSIYNNVIVINFNYCKKKYKEIYHSLLIDNDILDFQLPEMPVIKNDIDIDNDSSNQNDIDINIDSMSDKMNIMKLKNNNDELYSKLSKILKVNLVNFSKENSINITIRHTKKIIIEKIIENIEYSIIKDFLN